MIDKTEMRSQLESMERAAREVLQQDASFFEALVALTWEIERDPGVRSALTGLHGSRQKVYSAFTPRVRVRVRTQEGVFALSSQCGSVSSPALEQENELAQELKQAATKVILNSRICRDLDTIVNEAVSNSEAFERTACKIKGRGCEVLISVDLLPYAQLRKSDVSVPPFEQGDPDDTRQVSVLPLSDYDLKFMKSLKIKADL